MGEAEKTSSIDQLKAELERLGAENELLRQKLTFDSATGLYRNEDFGREELIKKIQEAINAGQEITLAIIDLKRLSRVNNQHSHAAGDEAIKALANWIKGFADEDGAGIRSHARGDEFGIMCIGKKLDIVKTEIKKSQASGIPWQWGSINGVVSFTLGMASVTPEEAAGKPTGEIFQSLWTAASAEERRDHQQTNG